jgi:ArsR family transcriptional regulator
VFVVESSTFIDEWNRRDMPVDVDMSEVEMPEPCCTPLTAPDLNEVEATELSEVFKVLADPARLRLLSLIANAPEGEACACDLVAPLDRSQPTVSHHLALLVEAGLLTREKRGRWAWYRLVPLRLEGIRTALEPAVLGSSIPARR